ncbi:ranaspumin-like [Mixophyes fleayi]|uniref:ranaspumin-like n=1 Tax=Mixophyes fleayi TaxID=3061075 RepID=UPI003F4D87BD
MFLITLLMLVGAALCNDGGTKDCAKPTSDDKNCLPNTLHNSAEIFQDFVKLVCEIRGVTPEKIKQNYQAFLKKLYDALTCLGCNVDNIVLRDGTTLRDLLGKGGTPVVEDVEIIIGKVLELIGISKETVDFICDALNPALTSKCLKKLIQRDLTQLAKDLQALACEAKKPDLNYDRIDELVKRVLCIAGDLLKALNILKENPKMGLLFDGELRDTINSLVATLTASLQLPTLDPACTLLGGGGGRFGGGLFS